MQVNTVLGKVEAGELGITLPHEHVFLDLYRVTRFRERLLNDVDLMTEEVELFKRAGGGTIVDVTTRDLGRRPEALREVSQRTGVHLVMATGRYREPWFEREIWERTTADLAAELIAEIEHGVDGIRPGIIGEIGADAYHISPAEERVHRAAARAQRASGLAITTHTIACPLGLQQLDIFEEEKADLRRVIIGHCDSYPFLDYHEAVLKRGAYAQFDLVRGLPGYEYESKMQVRLICELTRRGYVRQLLISHDICDLQKLAVNGGPGYAYIPTRFVKLLEAAGVAREQIDTIIIENPRRALSGEA
jgi:phosphotriesterase-related protein